MKTYTRAQALQHFADQILAGNVEVMVNHEAGCELMAYSGLYEWPGGEFRDEEYNAPAQDIDNSVIVFRTKSE